MYRTVNAVMIRVIAVAACCLAVVHAGRWGYGHEGDSAPAPAHWATYFSGEEGFCDGSRQSPINIDSFNTVQRDGSVTTQRVVNRNPPSAFHPD